MSLFFIIVVIVALKASSQVSAEEFIYGFKASLSDVSAQKLLFDPVGFADEFQVDFENFFARTYVLQPEVFTELCWDDFQSCVEFDRNSLNNTVLDFCAAGQPQPTPTATTTATMRTATQPTATDTITASLSDSPSGSLSTTRSLSESNTFTHSLRTRTESSSLTPTDTISVSPTRSLSVRTMTTSLSNTLSHSLTVTSTATLPTSTVSFSLTLSPSASLSASMSTSLSASLSSSSTMSPSPSQTQSKSKTTTITSIVVVIPGRGINVLAVDKSVSLTRSTRTSTSTSTATITDTVTESESLRTPTVPTPSETLSVSLSGTLTLRTPTMTSSPTGTETLPTGTVTFTESHTFSQTLPTASVTFSNSLTETFTIPTATLSFSVTESLSESIFISRTTSDTLTKSNTLRSATISRSLTPRTRSVSQTTTDTTTLTILVLPCDYTLRGKVTTSIPGESQFNKLLQEALISGAFGSNIETIEVDLPVQPTDAPLVTDVPETPQPSLPTCSCSEGSVWVQFTAEVPSHVVPYLLSNYENVQRMLIEILVTAEPTVSQVHLNTLCTVAGLISECVPIQDNIGLLPPSCLNYPETTCDYILTGGIIAPPATTTVTTVLISNTLWNSLGSQNPAFSGILHKNLQAEEPLSPGDKVQQNLFGSPFLLVKNRATDCQDADYRPFYKPMHSLSLGSCQSSHLGEVGVNNFIKVTGCTGQVITADFFCDEACGSCEQKDVTLEAGGCHEFSEHYIQLVGSCPAETPVLQVGLLRENHNDSMLVVMFRSSVAVISHQQQSQIVVQRTQVFNESVLLVDFLIIEVDDPTMMEKLLNEHITQPHSTLNYYVPTTNVVQRVTSQVTPVPVVVPADNTETPVWAYVMTCALGFLALLAVMAAACQLLPSPEERSSQKDVWMRKNCHFSHYETADV
eukprot:TRINITY_DN8260_c0_g1_i1.p1 TRINITY_DN8260_c0_g1~~TRINITY_DN8260_c0_g1_i1.p1  ORF type:complete len:931 (+),score=146.12 TRINITY_DN8260_c0_g1_i1:40-2793(+)